MIPASAEAFNEHPLDVFIFTLALEPTVIKIIRSTTISELTVQSPHDYVRTIVYVIGIMTSMRFLLCLCETHFD